MRPNLHPALSLSHKNWFFCSLQPYASRPSNMWCKLNSRARGWHHTEIAAGNENNKNHASNRWRQKRLRRNKDTFYGCSESRRSVGYGRREEISMPIYPINRNVTRFINGLLFCNWLEGCRLGVVEYLNRNCLLFQTMFSKTYEESKRHRGEIYYVCVWRYDERSCSSGRSR